MQRFADGTRPVKILLVEDNPDDVRLTMEALREGKISNQLSVVADGVEALRYLRQEHPYTEVERPDLILLDLNLPRMDGRELLGEIQADPQLRTMPVAIVTASTAEQDVQVAERLQVTCYVTKPIDVDQMLRIVDLVQDFGIAIVSVSAQISRTRSRCASGAR